MKTGIAPNANFARESKRSQIRGPRIRCMPDVDPQARDLRAVPLFPLPNVVLFPAAILPLHIFEERYKAMTADALDGDRSIAMALLRPGWEKSYYGRPEIEPIACVGRIISHERLPDGNYNFLLQGMARARIESELPSDDVRLYRVAKLRPLAELAADESDLVTHRQVFSSLLENGPLAQTTLAKQFREMLQRGMPMSTISDIAAFALIDDVQLKQQLLAELDIRARVDRTLEALVAAATQLTAAIHAELN